MSISKRAKLTFITLYQVYNCNDQVSGDYDILVLSSSSCPSQFGKVQLGLESNMRLYKNHTINVCKSEFEMSSELQNLKVK